MDNTSIRKQPTLSQIRKRTCLKSFTLPFIAALVGIGLKLSSGYQPAEALLNAAQAVWMLFTNQQGLEAFIANHPAIQWLVEWGAAPIVFFGVAFGIAKCPPVRWLIDLLFPDPPAFVFADLVAEREATMTRLDRAALPLMGRESELTELITLLNKEKMAPPFRWQMLSGPSGVGKTRLAIEWLMQAKLAGWDFGIIDPQDSELLKGWRARRPTALVIDEARSAWPELETAIARLQSGSGKRRPVRVLVVAQLAPYASGSAPEEIKDSEAIPAMTLPPLEGASLAELVKSLASDRDRAEMIIRESGGRPRAAIILANSESATDLAGAMAAWAFRVVPELRSEEQAVEESLALGVIAASLAGPFTTAPMHSFAPSFSVLPLLRFFPSMRQDELETTLPALLPEDLGQELAMRLLPRLGTRLRVELIALLIEQAPERIATSLGAIWRDHPDYFDGTGEHGKLCSSAVVLRVLQSAFDNRWNDRVQATRELAADIVNLSANEHIDQVELNRLLAALLSIVHERPFDSDIRRSEAKAAGNAILLYSLFQDSSEVARWVSLLVALAEHPDFTCNADIRLSEAIGIGTAIIHYGKAEDFTTAAQLGTRLVSLAEHPEFSGNIDICLMLARGALHSTYIYRKPGHFEALESSVARLTALAEHPDFSSNTDLRLYEAKGVNNAISSYAEGNDLDAVERLGARLIALAEHPDFSGNVDIRLQEAKAAMGLIGIYGQTKSFKSLEWWGERIIALAEHPAFSGNVDIRLQEANGIVNAINHYGEVAQFKELEGWGARIITLSEHPDFLGSADFQIQYGRATQSAMRSYGEAKKFEELERWGARIIALSENPEFSNNEDIRLSEANCAANAILIYGRSQEFEALKRWGARLIALSDDPAFSNNDKIKIIEARGAANALGEIRHYGKSNSSSYVKWLQRLAKAALAFPYHSAIQQDAKKWGVDYLEQRARGWPYGTGE